MVYDARIYLFNVFCESHALVCSRVVDERRKVRLGERGRRTGDELLKLDRCAFPRQKLKMGIASVAPDEDEDNYKARGAVLG